MDKAIYDKYLELTELVEEEAQRILKTYYMIRYEILGERAKFPFLSFIGIEDGDMLFEGDEYWQYGGHEFHSKRLPAFYLTDPDWETIVRKEAEFTANLKKQQAEKERQTETNTERALYEKLKEKYGNEA
jgi:hypothetical protein